MKEQIVQFLLERPMETHGYDDVAAARRQFPNATMADIIEAIKEAALKFATHPAKGLH